MILPDVNMLLYAYDRGSKFHASARTWLEQALLTDEVFFSWHTITGFLRIVTNPRILTKPATLDEAVAVVDSWLALDNTHLVHLEKRNWPLFKKVLIDAQANGNLVMDAHLAAIAASCGGKVATTDRDFTRFAEIQSFNPIKPTSKILD